MSLRGRAILVAIVVVLLGWSAAGSLFPGSGFVPTQGINLGLDLQGGIHWLLRIDTGKAIEQELKNYLGSIRQRAEELSVDLRSAEIRVDDEVIVLEGDVDRLATLVADEVSADLAVAVVGTSLEVRLDERERQAVLERGVEQAIEVIRERVDQLGVTEPVIAPQGNGRILVQLPGADVDRNAALELLKTTTFLEFKKVLAAAPSVDLLEAGYPDGLPADTESVVREVDPRATGADADPDVLDVTNVAEAFLVPTEPITTGACLEDARVSFDQVQRPIVTFQWNTECAAKFAEFTGNNIGQRLAAIIDGKVVTAPVIQARIRRRGQIDGFTQEEAARIAIALRSGALPIPLEVEEERTVGPSLGQDSIDAGLRSIAIGGALVVVFMLIYYRTGGLFADIALVLNLVLILGAMSLLRATLTLPGIAGLVLTVGMAVDANVIIFERIREELRSGKVLRTAVTIGFKRSALTILDANVTTLIAAVALLQFGRGPVQGFGVTLATGIVASVFSALFVTRLLFDLVLARNPEGVKV